MKRNLFLFIILVVLTALSACTSKTGLSIDEAWVRPAPLPGGNGAGYMTIRNYEGEPDTLLSVEVSFAEVAEIHETMDMGNDVMTMQVLGPLEIPARESIALAPGGYHIMLMNIPEPLEVGQVITLTLTFERAGAIEVQAEVREE